MRRHVQSWLKGIGEATVPTAFTPKAYNEDEFIDKGKLLKNLTS
jgi:hypothetical protein